MLLLVTYKWLRNYADDLSVSQINIHNLIEWEKDLFGGTMPGAAIQSHLWDQPYTPLLDVMTNTLYLSHFLSPLVLSVLLSMMLSVMLLSQLWGLMNKTRMLE